MSSSSLPSHLTHVPSFHLTSFSYAASLRNLTLRLLLIILTATDNISQNVMLEYIMMNSVFESIMHVRMYLIHVRVHMSALTYMYIYMYIIYI